MRVVDIAGGTAAYFCDLIVEGLLFILWLFRCFLNREGSIFVPNSTLRKYITDIVFVLTIDVLFLIDSSRLQCETSVSIIHSTLRDGIKDIAFIVYIDIPQPIRFFDLFLYRKVCIAEINFVEDDLSGSVVGRSQSISRASIEGSQFETELTIFKSAARELFLSGDLNRTTCRIGVIERRIVLVFYRRTHRSVTVINDSDPYRYYLFIVGITGQSAVNLGNRIPIAAGFAIGDLSKCCNALCIVRHSGYRRKRSVRSIL